MRVLIADDDRDFASALAELVRACSHEVVETVTGGGRLRVRHLGKIGSFYEH